MAQLVSGNNKAFSVGSSFKSLLEKMNGIHDSPINLFGRPCPPQKVLASIWPSLVGQINTPNRVERKNSHLLSPQAYPICLNEFELLTHLLLDCSIAAKIWIDAGNFWG